MKIRLSEKECDFLIRVLKEVDKRSFDPAYKTVIDRMILQKDGNKTFVNLEETEVYRLLEALEEFIEYTNTNPMNNKEKSEQNEQAKYLKEFIFVETGLFI